MKYWNENTKKLKPYLPGEQPDPNAKVIKLNTNENPYPPSEEAVRAMTEFNADKLRLYPNPNADSLRNSLAEYHAAAVDEIVCGNGSDEILDNIFQAFVEKGKRLVFTDPTYTVYESLALKYGYDFEIVDCLDDFSIPLERIPNAEDVIFFLANPNAQTGLMISSGKIEAFLKDFSGLLIVDEAYTDFAEDNCAHLTKKYSNVIITRTFSKSFSLCGIRLGYSLACQELSSALMRVKDSYNINALSQSIGKAAVESYGYTFENVKRIIESRESMKTALKGLGFLCTDSKANFILAKAPGGNAEALYLALKERGIFVRFFKTDKLKEYLRISIGTPEENDELLTALRMLINVGGE